MLVFLIQSPAVQNYSGFCVGVQWEKEVVRNTFLLLFLNGNQCTLRCRRTKNVVGQHPHHCIISDKKRNPMCRIRRLSQCEALVGCCFFLFRIPTKNE